MREVKQTLLEGILALPDTQLNGDSLEEASPYVLNVTFKGLRSEVLCTHWKAKGIVVSYLALPVTARRRSAALWTGNGTALLGN